ncbi:hypothetical protein IVB30_36670 [Bradyrhizobium sp. 200]|uniref:hypothetical protein n=1 Tax=Bradyrhizobium sp. 200 TaxID=2782665 RepID=UPI001FFE4DFB|nr:hypothetical protein [Bradyrhizobium sp. 200]UPJ48523.1 hypothetical protein IVB30_36670 [Bradyrhizobium sp. 200]
MESDALARILSDWDFGSMEVDALFMSGNTIKPTARAFTDFLIPELRYRLRGAFLAVMDTIALPEWSPDLVAERTGWSGRRAEISHESKTYFALLAYTLVETGG